MGEIFKVMKNKKLDKYSIHVYEIPHLSKDGTFKYKVRLYRNGKRVSCREIQVTLHIPKLKY